MAGEEGVEPNPRREKVSPAGGRGSSRSRPAPATRTSDRHSSQRPAGRRAEPRAIQKAIEEANEIIATLKAALDDMEELLETLELAERQQDIDERELESLKRALRQMHRPRESGSRH